MRQKDINTEEVILKAAEEVFLTKGYAGAKTTEIAKIAGVNHAMLHYYFRTKENLFNKVFEKKVNLLTNMFEGVFDKDIPFMKKVELAVTTHFDFIAENPQLPSFVITEILASDERKKEVKDMVFPKMKKLFMDVQMALEKEIAKGKIKDISAIDLILNIVSLNIFSFVIPLMLDSVGTTVFQVEAQEFLNRRKENNLDVILKSLQP